MDERPLLIVLRHPPGESLQARESIDLVMACGAFIPETTVLFRDAGVLQLAPDQAPDAETGHSHVKLLHALREYGIERCYAHAASLSRYGLSIDNLCIPCREADESECTALLRAHRQLIGI